jgi:GntP family gluconate:H+ symporter
MIAEFLKIELGYALVAGLCASLPLAVMVLWLAGWFENKYSFPMREVGGISSEDLKNTLAKNENELPPLFLSYLPILLPVALISMISLLKVLGGQGIDLGAMAPTMENPNFRILSFFGEPNIAMALAALVSVILLARQSQAVTEDGKSILSKTLEAPLVTAGSIILITGAGGAYGGMIRLSGVGEVIAHYATRMDLSYVLLAWGITAFVRIAQGSATVAMITGPA